MLLFIHVSVDLDRVKEIDSFFWHLVMVKKYHPNFYCNVFCNVLYLRYSHKENGRELLFASGFSA